ncbi:MAG: TetR/AcrR family transcriptional regulator [Solirubrobacteraceae bacterium]
MKLEQNAVRDEEGLSGPMAAATDAARQVIIRNGLEATTLRDIAREGGFTTGLLSHHFADKRDVIVAAFAGASRDFTAWAWSELNEAETIEALVTALLRVSCPADHDRRAEWRLWAEMWAYAGRDLEFAQQIEVTDAVWTKMVRSVLERCHAEGRLRSGIDLDRQAEILNRLIDGLGLRAWLSHDWESPRACLEEYLRTLGLEREVAAARANATVRSGSEQED